MRKIVVSVSERCGGFLSGESLRLDGGKQGLLNWECGQRAGFIWRAKDDISFKLRDAAWRQRTEPAVQRARRGPGRRGPGRGGGGRGGRGRAGRGGRAG